MQYPFFWADNQEIRDWVSAMGQHVQVLSALPGAAVTTRPVYVAERTDPVTYVRGWVATDPRHQPWTECWCDVMTWAPFWNAQGREPEHRVTLALTHERGGIATRTWVIRPLQEELGQYALRMTLPAVVEARALAESDRRSQSLEAKGELGGRLDIYWDPRGAEAAVLPGPRLFRLVFAGRDLRQPQTDSR